MPHGPEILDVLRAMNLTPGDYAVFGSGPMLARRLIDEVNDLDVLCRGEAWNQATAIGEMVDLDEGVQVATTHDGAITFGRSWAYGEFDIDDLIETADILDGLPFVKLEHVAAFKRAANRPKDQHHLAILDNPSDA